MQHINLVDPSLLPPLRLLSGHRLLGLLALAACAVTVHGGIERQRLAQAMAQANAAAPAASDSPQTAPAATSASADLQHRIAQRQLLLQAMSGPAVLTRDAADALQRVMGAVPDSLWLTELDLHGARGLRIAGGALDPAALGVFAERLALAPALRGLPIETLRLSYEAGAAEPGEGHESAAVTPPHHRFVLANLDAPVLEAAR
jgi:hypothetical protein